MFFGKVHISALSQNGSSWIKNIFWLLKDLSMIYHLYKFHFYFWKGSWNTAAWKWLPKPYFAKENFNKSLLFVYIIQIKYNYRDITITKDAVFLWLNKTIKIIYKEKLFTVSKPFPKPYFAKENFNKSLLFINHVLYNSNKV